MFKICLLVTAAALSCVPHGQASSFNCENEDTPQHPLNTTLCYTSKGEKLNSSNSPRDDHSDSEYSCAYSDNNYESVGDEDDNSSANKNVHHKNIEDMSNDDADEYVKKKTEQIHAIMRNIDPNKINESIYAFCYALSIAGSGLNPLENLKDYADVLRKLWARLQPPSKCEDISASCVLPQALCKKITAESQKAVQEVWRGILNLIKKDLEKKGEEKSAILDPSSPPALFSELIRTKEWLMVQTIVQLTTTEQIEDLIGTIKLDGTEFYIQQEYNISGSTFLRMIKAGLLPDYLEEGETAGIKEFIAKEAKDDTKNDCDEGWGHFIAKELDTLREYYSNYKQSQILGRADRMISCFGNLIKKAGTGLETLSEIKDYDTPLNRQYIQLGYGERKMLSADCILGGELCDQLTDATQQRVIDEWNNFLTFIQDDLNEADSFIINHGFADALCDEAWLAVQAIVLLTNSGRRDIILASKDTFGRTAENLIRSKFGITGADFLTVVEAGKFSTLLKEGPYSPEIQRIIEAVR